MSRYDEFLKSVLRACQGPLEGLGMVRRSVVAYTMDLPSGRRIGKLGFNSSGSRNPVALRVNPLVIVTDLDVARARQTLLGRKFHPHEGSTMFTPIGYLMDQQKYFTWKFSPDEPIEDGVADMVRMVAEHGIPFMRSHDDLGKLIEKMTLTQPWAWPHAIPFDLPVALALAGRREEADAYVERKLKEYEGATYPAAEQFRGFARQFSEWRPGR